MIDAKTLNSDIQQILRLIDRQFGIQADDLASAMRKIGRRLPKSAHRNAQTLIKAQSHAQNPKIAIQLDPAPLKAPHDALVAAIEAYDRKDAMKGRALDIASTLAFNLLCALVLIALVAYFAKSG